MFSSRLILRLLTLYIINISVLYTQDYWLRENSPTGKDLIKCFFIDSLYGWVCGDSGIIINTTNAGNNWNIQTSGVSDYKIEEIFFLNRNLGWAIYNDYQFKGTNILKTTNGGLGWIDSRFPDSSLIFNNIFFIDSLNGFLSGQSGKIYKTTNGGAIWKSCVIDTSSCPYLMPKYDIYFVNALTGFACGGAVDFSGIVWRSTNGGSNWQTYCISAEPLYVIKKIKANEIVVMGGDFEFGASIVYSSNNGNNWNYGLTLCFGATSGFSIRTPKETWAVLSFSNVMALNLDSLKPGSEWLCIPTPENSQLYDLQFTTPTLGWAFGKNGAIFKYNPNVIGIEGSGGNIPRDYFLYQNYPNPFNGVTIINYGIPNSALVDVIIYDLQGREVKSFHFGYLNAGKYNFKLTSDDLSSGIYFYKLKANSFSITKKMVLIK